MMVVARVHCELHLCKTMEVVVASSTVETAFGVLQNASWCVTTQLTLERVALLHLLHTCAFRVLPGLLVTLLCVSLMKS